MPCDIIFAAAAWPGASGPVQHSLAPIRVLAVGAGSGTPADAQAGRPLAAATPVGLIETSGGQEDVQSFAWEAAGKLSRALRHARAVTACELMAGYQAAALSGRTPPAGSRVLLEWLADVIGPIEDDRPFGEDLERLIAASFQSATDVRRRVLAHNHLSRY